MPPQPIVPLVYASLAELHETYMREFVLASPISASCGCKIHCYEHHFVHMVKLFGPEQVRLEFPSERQKIVETPEGFGTYEHEPRRAARLLAALETLKFPDFVSRPPSLGT